MQKYTKEQLEAQYKKLPETLRDALFSVDIASKIYGIGRRFGLTIEKTGFMAEETGYVVLGLTRPTEFMQSLAAVLETEESKTRAIANEINNLIFFPLREALKTAHQIEIGEEETQKEIIKTPTAPPLPKPTPRPTPPSAPKPVPSLPAMPEVKPPVPQPSTPPSLPKSPEEKIPAPPAPPVTPKIPPLDLRQQARPRPTELLPKPEIMGKGIFGAPPSINNIPKSPTAPAEKPTPPQPPKTQPRSFDPYREQTE